MNNISNPNMYKWFDAQLDQKILDPLKIIHPMLDGKRIMRSKNLTFSWVRAPAKEIFFF